MLTKRSHLNSAILILSLLLTFVACNPSENRTTVSGPVARVVEGQPIDPATVGSISGTVTFAGTPPKRVPLDMDQDPACSMANRTPAFSEAVVVNNGKLANAFVYVKQGPGKYAVPAPTSPVVLDQKGCRYEPHVLGLMTGQKLRILNSDSAMHNVHPSAVKNESWNISQMPGAAPIEKVFTEEELMLPVSCNQHPWMKMYLNVLKHPYFAVSDNDGKFEIKELPPGDYTLAVVHEKLGAGQEMQITLAPKENKSDLHFAYTAPK